MRIIDHSKGSPGIRLSISQDSCASFRLSISSFNYNSPIHKSSFACTNKFGPSKLIDQHSINQQRGRAKAGRPACTQIIYIVLILYLRIHMVSENVWTKLQPLMHYKYVINSFETGSYQPGYDLGDLLIRKCKLFLLFYHCERTNYDYEQKT